MLSLGSSSPGSRGGIFLGKGVMGVPEKLKAISAGIILAVVRAVYCELRPWLREQAKASETPVDDRLLDVLDRLLGVS